MKLESLTAVRGLVEQAPSTSQIKERGRMLSPEPVELFYGETYDAAGNPIDSLKYYLFLSELADSLREEGISSNPSVLIADTAACRNVSNDKKDFYMNLGDDRERFVRNVNRIYGTGLNVVRMSDFIDSEDFIAERARIMDFCSSTPELMAEIERTVPESKIEIERSKGFLYSFDEITTILGVDLKVGPPRENLYDEVARSVAASQGKKQLMSLFLTPTFPLGMKWSYFFANEGIEDHGITAYKAASKRLQDQRLIIGRTTLHRADQLIDESFVASNPELPNPVLDIGIIAAMAKKRLEDGDPDAITLAERFYAGELSEAQLRAKVKHDVGRYVLSQF